MNQTRTIAKPDAFTNTEKTGHQAYSLTDLHIYIQRRGTVGGCVRICCCMLVFSPGTTATCQRPDISATYCFMTA